MSTGLLRIGDGEQLAGIAVNQILLTAALAAAVGYLYLTRARKGPDVVEPATGEAPGSLSARGAGLRRGGPAAGRVPAGRPICLARAAPVAGEGPDDPRAQYRRN